MAICSLSGEVRTVGVAEPSAQASEMGPTPRPGKGHLLFQEPERATIYSARNSTDLFQALWIPKESRLQAGRGRQSHQALSVVASITSH